MGQRVPLLALIVLACAGMAVSKDLALISNKTNHVQAVTQPDLSRICKGQLNRWPDGKAVTFISRDPALPEMKLLLQKVYEMSADEVRAVIASANHGRSEHPAIILLGSDEDVVKKVETTPGAVGIVDVYAITGGVTVVHVAGKLPLEPGYLIHGN